MKINIPKKTYVIIIVYLIALIIFNINIEQYQSYVKEFPDEFSHVAYIAYLEQTGKVIPEFENMKELELNNGHLKEYKDIYREMQDIDGKDTTTTFVDNSINHLGHPPLYYHIMKLFGAVKYEDGMVTYNAKMLRTISQIISNISLIIIFIFAFKNLKSVLPNFVFAMVLVNIPLFPYISGALSNDVLSLLGMGLFLIGISDIVKKKRNYLSYFIFSLGIFVCMMNKVTTGVIVVIATIIIFIYLFIREKNLKFIICKQFAVTLPIYLLIFAYYVFIIQKYGTIQPVIQSMNFEYYKTTRFYNESTNRNAYSFVRYAHEYFERFVNYWAGYKYSQEQPVHQFIECMASFSILFLPIVYVIHKLIKKEESSIVNLAVCIGIYIAMIIQFVRQYIEFKSYSGYLGGYHSRYYICGMPAFVLLFCLVLDNEKMNKIFKTIITIIIMIITFLMQFVLYI